jgi:prepilin-type N-terminal cleavage/methylation domain-containing protein
MILSSAIKAKQPLLQAGFTLAEVVIAVGILGVSFVSLYAGMSAGFSMTQISRENLRATQIMVEKMEGIRLFNWNQLTVLKMVPTEFTTPYYPNARQGQSGGTTYSGTISITDLPSMQFTPAKSYDDNLRVVTVEVNWMSGNIQRSRSMSTLVSKNGLQNYVFYR